ncbi:acyl transferase domain-containing protein [Phlyctema vagabunda]|uniref:Acyl transferase domain-containing protein n=1 Tax=Phlyctema vagabunda TaxID=108571 RepID=A0ABR4PUK6_9HELO
MQRDYGHGASRRSPRPGALVQLPMSKSHLPQHTYHVHYFQAKFLVVGLGLGSGVASTHFLVLESVRDFPSTHFSTIGQGVSKMGPSLKNADNSASTDSSTSATSWSVSTPKTTRKGEQFQTLSISHSDFLYHFDIPQNLHFLASQLKASYFQSIAEDTPLPESLFESVLSFIDFIARDILASSHNSTSNHQRLLRALLNHIDQQYVTDDIHAVAAKAASDAQGQARLTQKYYEACHVAHHIISSHKSALLESTRTRESKIFAILGGQGITTQYFEELRLVYDVYGKYISDYLVNLNKTLISLVSNGLKEFYPEGLDFMGWLASGKSLNTEYLASAPVSFPLIGVLQLSHYYVCMKVLGKSPFEMLQYLSGIAGHSQGCVIAAVIAGSDSWDSFLSLSQDALQVLFWIGARSQKAFPQVSCPARIVDDSVAHGEGVPSPMLSVREIKASQIQEHIDAINSNLPPSRRIAISLSNGPRSFVVTGPALSLYGLNVRLRQVKTSPDTIQSRIPYSQRKLPITNRFLTITAPFHSNYLESAVEVISQDVKNIVISSQDLKIPLYDNTTGEDIRNLAIDNIIPTLVRSVAVSPLFWEKATNFPGATHILDFGPGAESSIGAVTNSNKEGDGVRTILASAFSTPSKSLGYKAELFSVHKAVGARSESWAKCYGPKLLRTTSGECYIDTKMSRFLKLPPIMVAGMTPTTVHWDFVAATMNAGYHIELACGGYSRDTSLSAAIKTLACSIQPGRGIALNVIFVNARQISWQIPLIRQLRSEGLPIDGLTVGGGVPSLDVAQEYIDTLGLRYISFKPGSSSAIDSVITIAQANPHFTIILQWTGGRAGGHHSFEDFHDPIIKAYGRIRAYDNIILVAGSGFGGFEDALPYLRGTWSRNFGYPCMPFDGILFGSRMMTAKEAHTSKEAKEAIVQTEGLADADWERTYQGVAGGILTVTSEMGEPIHMLATRAVQFWSEMDKIFAMPKAVKLAELQKRKSYIISKLNNDFAKVWFGKSKSGDVVDLWEMTYYEIIRRMVELMFITSEGRWIDNSLSALTEDFIKRMDERFSSDKCIDSHSVLYDPHEAVELLKKQIPAIEEQLVAADDVLYFLYLCQRSGQKPVPFIPIFDENFENWFKKDSLWQSEDITAVVGQDVQRTCILQGPTAATYSKTSDEPIRTILDRMNSEFISFLSKSSYNNRTEKIPYVEYLTDALVDASLDVLGNAVQVVQNSRTLALAIPVSDKKALLPVASTWLRALSGPIYSWRHALFSSEYIYSGSKRLDNPIRRICEPTSGLSVTIRHWQKTAQMSITIENPVDNTCSVVITSKEPHNLEIRWILPGALTPTQKPEELKMVLSYHPETPTCLLRMDTANYTDDVFDLYRRLWLGNEQINLDDSTSQKFDGGNFEIKEESVLSFSNACGYDSEVYSQGSSQGLSQHIKVPLHFGMAIAWKALTKPLFLRKLGGNLLSLVHLSNSFKVAPGAEPLRVGEVLSSSSSISAVIIRDSGKLVRVCATIHRNGEPAISIESEFLFRGIFTDYENTFENLIEEPVMVHLKTEKDLAILFSKSWFVPTCRDTHLLDSHVKFSVETMSQNVNGEVVKSLKITGKATVETVEGEILVGSIRYQTINSHGNPVNHYLKKYGVLLEMQHDLQNPIILHGAGSRVLKRKVSSSTYASLSGDNNPIHLSKTFAGLAGLPGTIVHGMQTSALLGSMLESWVHGDVTYFAGSFLGMVPPGADVQVEASLQGMVDGNWVVSMQARDSSSGTLVMKVKAIITCSSPAYLFTGQGSQKPMMGMDLYDTSSVARDVWDTADDYFSENYGFKISKIVRENPKALTIYFGGLYGQRIRQNYMDMTMQKVDGAGKEVHERIFSDIDHDTQSYTFRSPNGLLFATQFTQPAITLMELAKFKDMKSKGLVPTKSYFAGHSLGEFASIAAIGQVMTIQQLVAILWFRGMAMQIVVDRDEAGASEYSMVAINPSRISNHLDEDRLSPIVRSISQETGMLLEIVNYNISNRQYVCAGELRAIDCLTQVLKYVRAQDQLHSTATSINEGATELSATIQTLAQKSLRKPAVIELVRSTGVVPLSGIDVPFHSTYLQSGIPSFRSFLASKIRKENVDPKLLVDKWIPNLVGKPFSIDRDYIEQIFQLTGSNALRNILNDWK